MGFIAFPDQGSDILQHQLSKNKICTCTKPLLSSYPVLCDDICQPGLHFWPNGRQIGSKGTHSETNRKILKKNDLTAGGVRGPSVVHAWKLQTLPWKSQTLPWSQEPSKSTQYRSKSGFVDNMFFLGVEVILGKWWNDFVISMVGGLLTAAFAVLQRAPCLLGREVFNENPL